MTPLILTLVIAFATVTAVQVHQDIFTDTLPNLTYATSDSDEEDNQGSSNSEASQEDAIQDKMQQKDDALVEMAEELYLNGSCIEGTDLMRLLTIPDVPQFVIDIPTC